MNKPFYKKWSSLAIIMVAGGVIGLTAGCNDSANEAAPAPTEIAQPTAAAPTTQPSAEPTASNSSMNWESAIKQISQTDTPASQKATAAEVLAKSYTPASEELSDFESQIVEEYTAGNYLAHIEDAEYMLTNLFKSRVVEQNHTEGEAIKEFAFDFYQNTKYTFRGAETVDSDAVQSNEAQMDKVLSEIKKK
ncbi:hypothetical protein KDC22_15190 [Paenibacillus tritici]|uniref:hypothetical protein n=1 Tax=Paenibacillus tritici TaxID=1873425 RepID=UPI001BA594DC|nr:hypothetical protein [Paenibacillus tritici]QUL57703.1 hypothetical protein KDC22_15190 [Paenibacillus tritici]